MLLTLHETNDPAWTGSPLLEKASTFALPRLRPWRRLAALVPAALLLATAVLLPQRVPAHGSTALADDVVADLTATVSELKQQSLMTKDEEKKLEDEIERLRRSAKDRVDSSSWEAADTLREKIAAGLSEKQDALKWAADSAARYAAAAQAGVPAAGSPSEVASVELMKALEKLAQSGLLAGAPADVLSVVKSGKLPADSASLRQLTASLSKYLAETNTRVGDLARMGREFGRFDPSEFPLEASSAEDGSIPGRGGIDRGRADAPLTWGKESLPFDRFKADALPPGAPRSPDDWAPLVELPGAPQESARPGANSIARQYAAAAGQTAWRRTLAPRHQSAVKEYFEK